MKQVMLPAVLLALACTSHAQGQPSAFVPSRAFIAQGGVSADGGYSVTAGVSWPWAWRRVSRSGEWTGMTEAFVSRLSSHADGGRMHFTQVGLVPVVRYRFDHGRSDWFMDAGIGLSYTDRLYQRGSAQFSTRFNFIDVVGVGFNLGERRDSEIGLRIAHISNAGIRKPNPGENYLQLRYAHSF